MPDNYFNYFTEAEERFQRRRGSALLLSTLDWALIETWKDAGIPLEAVLRGIDAAFDAYERRGARARTRKVNSLAYCSQEVLAAAQEMQEAAVGARRDAGPEANSVPGMAPEDVSAYLLRNADVLERADVPVAAQAVLTESAAALRGLASAPPLRLEDLERNLTVLEDKIFAAMHVATSHTGLLEVRSEADRDIAPYRSKMAAAQIEQLHRQYVNKRLMERARLPRLSLFYMV